MLSETIQTVKAAEAEAETRIAEARNRAASIVKQAGIDADRIRKDAEQDAAAYYEKTMREAMNAGEQRLKESAACDMQECFRLRQKAAEQEPEAVQKVIRLVLGG
jgi:V/A-type H+-transporting ATPase subunit G/H